MNKRLFTTLLALLMLMLPGMNMMSANENVRKAMNANPRADMPRISRAPDWAPKMLSNPAIPSLEQGLTTLNVPMVTPDYKISSPSGALLQGLRAESSDPNFQFGWYEFNTAGEQAPLWTSTYIAENIGFVRNGEILMFYSVEIWGMIIVNWRGYDLYTGDATGQGDLDASDYSQMVLSVVYDEWEDVAYAYTYNRDMTDAWIQKIDPETMTFTPLNTSSGLSANRVVAWAYNPRDHQIYGVNLSGEFVKMNKADGTFTVIGNTNLVPETYAQSMVYSPLDDKFIWAGILPGAVSCLFQIDPETGHTQATHRFDYTNQYTILWTPDQLCDDNAPGLPKLKSLTFDKASLTGHGVVTLPSVDYRGNQLTGEVMLKISDDRTILHSALSGQAGSDVEFDITVAEGMHNITATPYLVIDGQTVEGPPVSERLYVGNDTPLAPQNVALTQTIVTWDPIGEVGVNKGWVDASQAKYNVYLNGVLQNSQPVAGTALAINISDDVMDLYTAEVEAVVNGKTSERGASAVERFGKSFSVPYYAAPTDEDFELFILTNNGYGMWRFFGDEEEPFYHVCHGNYDSDDWVFLPLINFEDTQHLYEVSFTARSLNANNPNSVQIAISKTPNPADAQIIETHLIDTKEYVTYKSLVGVPEAGDYYIALRCNSVKRSFYLYAKDINVKATDKVRGVPAACEYLTATAAPEGGLSATVEFTMPKHTLDGQSLYISGETLTAHIASGVETVTVTGEPGEEVSATVRTEQGLNDIWVSVANSEGKGKEERVGVYCGEDIPTHVNYTIDASEDNLTAVLKWEAPETGKYGAYLNPDNLVYTIYNADLSTGEWNQIGQVVGGNEFTYTPRRDYQQMLQLGMTVSNDYGGGEELVYATVVVGKPYELPMKENFNGAMAYEPIVQQPMGDDYSGQWTFFNPGDIDPEATNSTGFALVGFPSTAYLGYGRMAFPKFSTLGCERVEAKLRFFIKPYTPYTEVLLCGIDGEEEVIGTVTSESGTGWTNLSFELPEKFNNRSWVYIALRATFDGTEQYLLMDQYEFNESVANDIAITSMTGTTSTMVGRTEKYAVTLNNNGYEVAAVPDLSCKLYDNAGNVVTELPASDYPMTSELQPGESLNFEFEFEVGIDYIGDFIVEAAFDNGDMMPENNMMQLPLNIKKGTEPIVTDLKATASDDKSSVELQWTAPVLSLGLEDFEDMVSFDYSDPLGDFINYDGDKQTVFIFGSWSYPDHGLPKAFQVFDFSQLTVSEDIFGAYSGDKYIVAIAPDNYSQADDWLISPQVNGGSSVSFMLNIINERYSPEYVEVMYSTTTQERDQFTVIETFSKSTLGWELLTFTLPEDAKYFAIHYVSTDTFGIMIDDIVYSPATDSSRIAGYNIYRNGQLIAEKVTSTSYTDTDITIADYRYNVTVVVEKDGVETEYPMSNNAYANLLSVDSIYDNIQVYGATGKVVIKGCEGLNYQILTSDAICLENRTADSDCIETAVAPGVYIVKVEGRIKKVIVK